MRRSRISKEKGEEIVHKRRKKRRRGIHSVVMRVSAQCPPTPATTTVRNWFIN
jgi:hypothetical protein